MSVLENMDAEALPKVGQPDKEWFEDHNWMFDSGETIYDVEIPIDATYRVVVTATTQASAIQQAKRFINTHIGDVTRDICCGEIEVKVL